MTATELINRVEHGTDAEIDHLASWLAWKMRGCPLTPPAHLNARGEAQWLTRLQAALRKPRPAIDMTLFVGGAPEALEKARLQSSIEQFVEGCVTEHASGEDQSWECGETGIPATHPGVTTTGASPALALSDVAPSVAQSVEPWVADSSSASGAASDAVSRRQFWARHGIEDRHDAAHLASMAERQARMRGQR